MILWKCYSTRGVNTWYHANSISFKCHSISVTFKFCAVLVALCAPEPRSTDSLGTQHCANFESHSNRVTFETNTISITSSIQALCGGSKVGHFEWIRKILVYQIAYFILFLLNIRYFILRLSSEQKACFWKGFLNFPLHFNFNFKLE